MAWVNVLAGSFKTGSGHHYNKGRFRLLTETNPHAGEDIPVTQLVELFPADSRSERLFRLVRPKKSLAYRLRRGLDHVIHKFSPNPETAVTFCAKFRDGRRMIARTDLDSFKEFDALLASQRLESSRSTRLSDAAATSRINV